MTGEKNEAVVDRLFYMQYILMGTTIGLGTLALRDFFFIFKNWHPELARKKIPKVFQLYSTE